MCSRNIFLSNIPYIKIVHRDTSTSGRPVYTRILRKKFMTKSSSLSLFCFWLHAEIAFYLRQIYLILLTERYPNLTKLSRDLADKRKTNQRRWNGSRGGLIELRFRRSRWFSEGRKSRSGKRIDRRKWETNPSTIRRTATYLLTGSDYIRIRGAKTFRRSFSHPLATLFPRSDDRVKRRVIHRHGTFLTSPPWRFVQDRGQRRRI